MNLSSRLGVLMLKVLNFDSAAAADMMLKFLGANDS